MFKKAIPTPIGLTIILILSFAVALLSGVLVFKTGKEAMIDRYNLINGNNGKIEGILVSMPKSGEKINNPFKIKGRARNNWFFEAEFTAELYDSENNFLGRAVLTTKEDWTKESFISFEGELFFKKPKTSSGILKFLSSNPSGISTNQKVFEITVEFDSSVKYREVLLYYYNPNLDKNQFGSLKCSANGLVPIKREIPVTNNPIKDTLKFMLKGKDNLSDYDILQGIDTEYPLPRFNLKSVNLKNNGTLILELEDPLHQTSGGSCRTSVLWAQIEATAKQFPEVKKVEYYPKTLFQP